MLLLGCEYAESNAPIRAYAGAPASFRTLTPKERQMVHHAETSYSLAPFLRYCLYPPLYLTGPTITFNDFTCNIRCVKPVNVRYPSHVNPSMSQGNERDEFLGTCLPN